MKSASSDASALERHAFAFHAARRLAQMKDDAVFLVERLHEAAELGPQNFLHRPFFRRDDMDLDVARAQRGRDFEADEARAEHDDPLCRLGAFDDRLAVLQRAKHEHVRRLGAGEGRGHRLGAGREKQAIVGKLVAGRERDFTRAGVDGRDGRFQAKVDGVVGIELGVAKRQPLFRRAAGEIVLGQIRPVDRRRVVAAQHDDAALVFLPAQHLGCGKSRRAAADDHDCVRLIPLCARLLLGLSVLLAHEDLAVALLDAPRADRTEGWRAKRLASAEIEAGVMPGTSHRIIDDEPFGERAVIVRALSADGEDLRPTAYEQHRLFSDMAGELGAVRQFGGGHSQRQIGAGRLRLIFSHSVLPNCSSHPSFTMRVQSNLSIKSTGVRRSEARPHRRRQTDKA